MVKELVVALRCDFCAQQDWEETEANQNGEVDTILVADEALLVEIEICSEHRYDLSYSDVVILAHQEGREPEETTVRGLLPRDLRKELKTSRARRVKVKETQSQSVTQGGSESQSLLCPVEGCRRNRPGQEFASAHRLELHMARVHGQEAS